MIKLLTHTDLDGVGCAILARLVYKDQVDIEFFHNPDELNSYLINHNLNYYESIYITDLSCNKELLTNKMFLFDHHKTALDLNNNDNYIVQIEFNNHLTCGTELFYQYFLKQNLIHNISFFVELIRLYDTWSWTTSYSKLPYYLNNLLYILGIKNFINKFTLLLQENDVNELTIFSESDKLLLNYQEKQIKKYVNNKIQYMDTRTIYLNKKPYSFGIIFADSNHSVLGNKMNVDIAIIINLNANTCSLRTNNDDIDLSILAKKINSNGGGHKKAAGCVLDNCIKEYIYQYVVNKLV